MYRIEGNRRIKNKLDIALSGGGVKGIAYAGVFKALENWGIAYGNLAGVSAGAIAASFAGSGYTSNEIWNAMDELNFKEIQLTNVDRLEVVRDFSEFIKEKRYPREIDVYRFFESEQRSDFLKNVLNYCKKGALFDGDYFEEWIRKCLVSKGIRKFGDLRGGKKTKTNPNGYRVRMTGIDINRMKSVIIPDDLKFYGINPDDFEVSRGVQISICVPFCFKPVTIQKKTPTSNIIYNLVDGGLFDTFPVWLLDNNSSHFCGFKITSGEHKFFSISTAHNMFKSLISAVQDIEVPKINLYDIQNIENIDTKNVKFLDFNISDNDKKYLYNQGIYAGNSLLSKMMFDVLQGAQ